MYYPNTTLTAAIYFTFIYPLFLFLINYSLVELFYYFDLLDYCILFILFVFPFWSFLRVANAGECDVPLALVVDKGSLEMTYSYNLNATPSKPAILTAAKDQCLRI